MQFGLKVRWLRSRQFGFSRRWPETGRFGCFSDPRGSKWTNHLTSTQKERCTGRDESTQVIIVIVIVIGLKRVLANGRNRSKATGRNYAAGSFMQESGQLQGVKRPKFRWLPARLSHFSCMWPQMGIFGPFLGPRGSRANPKTPIWPPRKNHR